MKKMFTSLFVFLLFSLAGYSQIYWDFSDSTGMPASNSYSDIMVSDLTSNLNNGDVTATITKSSASKDYANASGTFNLGAAALIGGINPLTTFFEVTLTPMGSSSVIFNTISFGTRSTSTGPQAYSIRTSLDDYGTDIATDMLTNDGNWTLQEKSELGVVAGAGVPLTIRIYGFNGSGEPSPGVINWRIDDITINGAVLPLVLTSFTSSVVNNKVMLNWTTNNEVSMKGFSVEKSYDGHNFSELTYVAASGNYAAKYSTQDAVSSGVSYYRLKMVNLDGSFTYSKNLPVNGSLLSNASLHIFPNPVRTNAVIAHPQSGKNASLKVLDMNWPRIADLYIG